MTLEERCDTRCLSVDYMDLSFRPRNVYMETCFRYFNAIFVSNYIKYVFTKNSGKTSAWEKWCLYYDAILFLYVEK